MILYLFRTIADAALEVLLLEKRKGKGDIPPTAQSAETLETSTLSRMAQQHHHDYYSFPALFPAMNVVVVVAKKGLAPEPMHCPKTA